MEYLLNSKKRWILLTVSTAVILSLGSYSIFMRRQSPKTETKFAYNAATTIAGTGITFKYPRTGFDGTGASIGNSDNPLLFVYDDVANYYLTSDGAGPRVYLNVYKLNGEKTLEETLPTLANQVSTTANGTYEELNGVRYLFDRVDPGVVSAYTVNNDYLLVVTFVEFWNDGRQPDENEARRFLEQLRFDCPDDCSFNSAPIIEGGTQPSV